MPAENDAANVPTNYTNVRMPDYRTVYANNAVFKVGVYDFSMIFGEVTDVDIEKSSLTVEQHVKVTMSPLHAKIFVAVALQQIKSYEDQFGKIELPKGLVVPAMEPPSATG
jgi:hypothetical protein